MQSKGVALYRICFGRYPNHGKTWNVGRFFSWNCAAVFIKSHGLNVDDFTIIDDNDIPF